MNDTGSECNAKIDLLAYKPEFYDIKLVDFFNVIKDYIADKKIRSGFDTLIHLENGFALQKHSDNINIIDNNEEYKVTYNITPNNITTKNLDDINANSTIGSLIIKLKLRYLVCCQDPEKDIKEIYIGHKLVTPTYPVNTKVTVIPKENNQNINKNGVVKYYGSYITNKKNKFQTRYGIELYTNNGKNNGTSDGIKYFDCKDNYGIFILEETRLEKNDDPEPAPVTELAPAQVPAPVPAPALELGASETQGVQEDPLTIIKVLKELLTEKETDNNNNSNTPEEKEQIEIASGERFKIGFLLNMLINDNESFYSDRLKKLKDSLKNSQEPNPRDNVDKNSEESPQNSPQDGGTVNNELKYIFDNFTL